MSDRLTYISLFSCAGIGCYGFKQADFECVATSELLEKRLNIQKYNNKCKYDSGYICGDITLDETKNKYEKLRVRNEELGDVVLEHQIQLNKILKWK